MTQETEDESIRSIRALLDAGQLQDALHLITQYLSDRPDDSWGLRTQNEIIQRLIPRWHFPMINDKARNVAFQKAIEQVVQSGDDVLDVGAGSGLLSMIAVKAGAEFVTSCELNDIVAKKATDIISKNGFSSKISVIGKRSDMLEIGVDIPQRAKVLISETLDSSLIGEGWLSIVDHARTNLLQENPQIIPKSACVYASLLRSEDIHELNHVSTACGFDVSDFNEFSTNTFFPVRLNHFDHTFASEPVIIADLNFITDDLSPETQNLDFIATTSGLIHGFVFWFNSTLCDGVLFSNKPGTESHWKQAVQTLSEPLMVDKGEIVSVRVHRGWTFFSFDIEDIK